ncbi:MAG: hypothetical protein HYZ15_11055 [Sphingobacteriales bacterium]|nr:hypothetical protein [Sphingobacteriales bacterium]
MKKIGFSLLTVLVISLYSCDPQGTTDSNTTQVVTSGNWRVSLFTDSGNDETSTYSGYTFLFNENGTLAASRNGSTRNGTWSINSSSNKFMIDLGVKNDPANSLGELTDDWKILSKSATEIRLGDDNTTSNEFLTFSKN